MWKRLFHEDWRTNLDFKTKRLQPGVQKKFKKRVFYGDYTVQLLNKKGTKVFKTKQVTIRKADGSATVKFTV